MESEENFEIAKELNNIDSKEKLINEIEADESLDPDTQLNAIKAVKLFSVNYVDAIKIAEVVNLLWNGKRRNEYKEDDMDTDATSSDNLFADNMLPVALEYKEIKTIEDIPKNIIQIVDDFKFSYDERLKIETFKKNKEEKELFDYVSKKIKELDGNTEKGDDGWKEVLDKLDQVNCSIETLKNKTKKFIEVWITKALIDYKEKQNNITERKENKFEIKGFENCEYFSDEDIKKFLYDNFKEDLLSRALVAELEYSLKFKFSGDSKLYDEKECIELIEKDPNIKNKIVLGNGDALDLKSPTEINIFSHKFADIEKYRYLEKYKDSAKIKASILGTVIHELGGHYFYEKILKLSEREEYKKICESENSNKSVTYYIEKRKQGQYSGTFTGDGCDEDFSESMRRFMTDYEDFKHEFPKRVEFIEKKFPEITKNGIYKLLEETK